MARLSIESLLNEMSSLNNELVNNQRELEKNNSEIKHLNAQLKKANLELQQFASIVSHNLRSPVANIVGLASILKEDISEEDKIQSQQYLFNAVEQLNEIIQDLNKILKSKSEINEINEVIEFEHIIKSIKVSIHILLEKEAVQIHSNFTSINKIKSNKSYIYSTFYNLISNSIKYKHINRTPIINITSAVEGEKIIIYFQDNGAGIDLEKNGDNLFGLYKRFDLDKDGKGLGLFMVKSQIETLGGNINVTSKLGEGTMFIIELPLAN